MNHADLNMRKEHAFSVTTTQHGSGKISEIYTYRGGLAGVLWPKAARPFLANAKHSPVKAGNILLMKYRERVLQC